MCKVLKHHLNADVNFFPNNITLFVNKVLCMVLMLLFNIIQLSLITVAKRGDYVSVE